MYHCGMRQVGERHIAYQVDLMVWSNRLDLLALSNFKGEVQIHRLQWQKVWNLPAPQENITVRAMAWRPDGKVLAIGYSSGLVYTLDIEDKDINGKFTFEQEKLSECENAKLYGVTSLTWACKAGTLESVANPSLYDHPTLFVHHSPVSGDYKRQFVDDYIKYLKEDPAPTQLHMLVVGYGIGYININIFGKYVYGTIHMGQVTEDESGDYKVIDCNVSDDFSLIHILYIDNLTNNLFVSVLNTSVLSAYSEEIFNVAKKHTEIFRLFAYIEHTVTAITETWEHILLEMDTKMAAYAAAVPEGGVSADLLELLMLGTPSDELEVHLLQKLTVNDLKKLGNSIECSYSTIQKLILKQLNTAGQSMIYFLSELRGVTRIPDRYKFLDIEESSVTAGIKASCAFLSKCLELQQVIDMSMRNYKAFFRWLFVVIVRLLGEQTPSEIIKITQQELGHIAEFLYNFDNVQAEGGDTTPEKRVKFNLERLSQYFQNSDLTILLVTDDNPWQTFLKDNHCILKDNDTIHSMSEYRKFSLLQQYNHLKDALNDIFDITKKDIGKYFSAVHTAYCYENVLNTKLIDSLRISQIYDAAENRFMVAFMDSSNERDGIYFMSVNFKDTTFTVNSMKYCFSNSLLGDNQTQDENLAILDLQFYSSEYLSVLTQHPNSEENSIFIQVPIKLVLEHSNEFLAEWKIFVFNDKIVKKNISPLLEQGVYKVLDKMDGMRIAVSGGRKVAVVLSKSRRKVRVFEMEVDGDDEEDETLDTTPQSVSTNEQVTPDKHNLTSAEDITF